MTYHDTTGAMRPKLSLRYGAIHTDAATLAPVAMRAAYTIPASQIPPSQIPATELRRLVAAMVD